MSCNHEQRRPIALCLCLQCCKEKREVTNPDCKNTSTRAVSPPVKGCSVLCCPTAPFHAPHHGGSARNAPFWHLVIEESPKLSLVSLRDSHGLGTRNRGVRTVPSSPAPCPWTWQSCLFWGSVCLSVLAARAETDTQTLPPKEEMNSCESGLLHHMSTHTVTSLGQS